MSTLREQNYHYGELIESSMGRNTLDYEIVQRITERYDVLELIELLDVTTEELVYGLEDKIIENIELLEVL